MDCCNFVPYRSPYYGTTSYYDCYSYPQEYYGHHYQDYYPAYYQQPWQCPTPFPDYVYNPKEARIRKAMREASRERAMGITPMASPRAGVRRTSTPANGWNFHGDEQLMMNPSNGMRGMIGSSMCGSPGFASVPTGGSGPFMPSMHYSKHVHPMSQHTSGSYMQPNPIGQLPQQHEIWHSYDDTIRNNSTGPFIIPPPMQSYHPPSMDTGSPVMQNGKPKLEVDVFPAQEEAQHVRGNDGSSMDDQVEKIAPIRESVFDSKVDSMPSIMQAESLQTNVAYIQPYSENTISQSGGNYENKEEIKMRKFSSKSPKCNNSNGYKPTTKPLPDFNEAFGSTERGRFQRPPNNKGYLDYFIQQENDMKFLEFPL